VKLAFEFEDGVCRHSHCYTRAACPAVALATNRSAVQRYLPIDIRRPPPSPDPGSNNSGYYELAAVLTHKGRSSDSGHYVGWVRNPDRKGT
jgi:hypothetical protein